MPSPAFIEPAPVVLAPLAVISAAPPSEPLAPLPPRIARPSEVACSWASDRWLTSSSIEMRIRPKGPVFAQVAGGPRAHVELPVGPRDRALLDAASGGLVLTGVVDASTLVLYAARPFSMNGVLYPESRLPLAVAEGLPGKITVTAQVPKEITLARSPLAGTTECSNVTLDQGTRADDMNQTIFGLPYGASSYLPSGRTIEVFSDPARPAAAKVFLSNVTGADEFGKAGAFSKVSFEVEGMFVAGWVRSSVVRSSSGRGGSGAVGFGYVGKRDPEHVAIAKVVCPENVPVAVEVDGETATVGTVLPGTRIEILERRGLFSRVFVANRGVHMLENAAFLARTSDLAACPPFRVD